MKLRSLTLLFILMLLASCTGSKKHYVIAVSSCSNDMWREKLNEEMTVSTYLYDNVKLKVQSANDDDRRQIEQINSFVDEGVDLLVVSPNQLKTISPAIERAYRRHIPVVLFDRKTDTDKYTAYIGADNFKVGKDMGEYVARHMNGHGNLVVINGLKGSSASIERNAGFMSVIKNYPGIKVVGTGYAGWFYDTAVEVMDSLLDHTKNIDCVFAQNDRMALGARHAVLRSGLKRKISYIGVDALPVKGGGIDCVSKGVLAASYIYPTRGDLVIQLAMNILEGRPYKRDTPLYGTLVTRDNAGALLLQNEELSKQRERLYKLRSKVDLYLAEYTHQRVYAGMALVIIALLLVSFALFYRSIIVRRRLEQQAADAKLVFFTNVSHEFRTPLTLIADPVDRLLADESLSVQQHSLLRLVRRNVDIMMRLVGEILDFRKVQKGKMDIRLSRFNLTEHVADWTEMFRQAAERKKISLTTDIEDGVSITADADKVEKIIGNLLSNAIKYTPEGGTIELSMCVCNENVRITVKDNGCGMTQEEAHRVFDRFYQPESSTGGTGIGLALVKAFTEMHHGHVAVETAPGKGSVFTVILPVKQSGEAFCEPDKDRLSDETKPLHEDEQLEGAAEPTGVDRMTDPELLPGQKPMVLVIDDNADVRSYAADLLHKDYDVIQAADGTTGLQRAVSEVPDIVVCDVMMPGIDGLEMCRRLKAETATSHIPVILLTARTMEEQRAEGYDCGADAYITKPFSGKVLMARIRNLLEIRRQLKSLYTAGNDNEEKRNDADSVFMAGFNKIVTAHIADSSLSVETVSTELGLSRVQMYRKVKALTGSTPVELIRITRLKRAEKLLKKGGRTVSEVAYEVGFSSPSYFAKCFKDYFGRLPSE